MEKQDDAFVVTKEKLVQKRKKFELRYTILEEIGKGAFGVVVKARNRTTGAIVAIKIIDKVKHYKHVAAIERELRILKRLDHPKIIKLYEWFDDIKKLYLVFEYCEGGELYESIVKFGKMEEKQAATICYQILLAINYMHKQGICHRDIKADNCLLLLNTPDSPLKVIDFGLAVEYLDPKLGAMRLSQVLGTTQYIAPEVLNRNYNEKCDLWSCGILLYFMLTNEMPFGAPNDQQLFELIRKGKFACPNDLSPYCASFLAGLLNVKPDQRMSAAQALSHPWFATVLTPQPERALNISCLRRYLALDPIQRTVLAYTVAHTSDALFLNEGNKFLELNKSGSGVLSQEEVSEWLSCFGEVSAERAFKEMGISRTKGITYAIL